MPKKKDRSKTQGDLGDEESSPLGSKWVHQRAKDGIFTGFTVNGVREGTGTLSGKNGFVKYQGQWHAGRPCGLGRRTYPLTGDRHEGGYKDGDRHGGGVYLWANGDRYSGEWDMGLMQGRGRFEWAQSGEIYTGLWEAGKMCGEGVKQQADGSRLSGTFLNGSLHGWAQKKFPEGDLYTGGFEDSVREGYGEYYWSDGSVYRGLWRDDFMHGVGEMTSCVCTTSRAVGSSSSRAGADSGTGIDVGTGTGVGAGAGTWGSYGAGGAGSRGMNSKRLAQWGTGILLNGVVTEAVLSYRGHFRMGQMWGSGTALLGDGSRYEGAWERDYCEGWGRMEYSDGSVYEGDWSRGQRHGQGQLTHHMEVDPAESGLGEGHGHGGGAFESPEEEFDFDAAPVTPAAAAVGTVPPGLEEVNELQQQHQEQEQGQSTGYSIESVLHTWGGVYMGHWAADDPHGNGSVVLKNGQVYRGSFRRGRIVHM
mmetsp:Transcript_15197/g.33521  ORF Transcript_15197/g.33521 Transcript_15197/m.33521 type:complete len:477 (-) Transcript_15197:1522-2952(-)